MSISIGCESFLALRNVRNGDLGRRLADHEVVVLAAPNQYQGSVEAAPPGVTVDQLLDFDWPRMPRLRSLILRSYKARKCYYDPVTIWQDLKFSVERRQRGRPLRRMLSLLRTGSSVACSWLQGRLGVAQRSRRAVAEAIGRSEVVAEYVRRFQQTGTQMVAAFSPEGEREIPLVEAGRKAGLPTAIMIRSRDNLAAKINHLPDADRYLVWSEVTRDYLHYLYPEIPREKVLVTGSPQFDRHLDPAFRLDRGEFFTRVGLDPERPLIVYTLLTPGLYEQEIDIAQHLADASHAGRFARRAQLLVRGHPRMFGSSHALLRRQYPEARAYPNPSQALYLSPEHEGAVVRLILEDESMHLATLAYQDVQVNVNGTMTIDSSVLDKPTVNIYYDLVRVPSGMSLKRFYARSDSRQMLSYGASRLAHDPEECIRLINQYLEDPGLDAAGRKRARDEDCGPLDGRAGERIADVFRQLVLSAGSASTYAVSR